MTSDTTLARARGLQQAGDPGAAEAACQEILAHDDPAAAGPARALLALSLFQLNRRGEALAALAQARSSSLDDAAAISDLGAATLLNGEIGAARELLEQAAASTAASAVDFNRLATARLMQGDLAAAEQAFVEATERRPDWAAAWSNLAGAQMRRLEPLQALANYQRALALEPANTVFADNRNAALVALGRGDEALGELEDELALQPGSAALHRRLGDLHMLLDQDSEAEAHFRAALGLDPDDQIVPLRLAELLLRGSRPQAARAVLEAAVAATPQSFAARAMLAATHLELGRMRPARQAVAELEATEPGALVVHLLRAQLDTQADRHEAANAELRAAIAKYPDAVEPQLRLGESLMLLGRIDEAIECYTQVARISPGALAALAQVRALPRDKAVIARMEGLAESQVAARPLRAAMCFALCKIFDRDGDHARAFHWAELGNRAERLGIDYSAARRRAAVDRLIEAFTPGLVARLRGAGSPSRRPIFVCGLPRSGTTLAEQVIAAHDAVHGAGELGAIPRIAAHLHRVLGTAVGYPRCMELFTAETAESAAQHYLGVIGGIDAEARHVVDKLPHNFMHVGLIALMFPQARIVHLARHPGDVALSNFFTNYRHKRGILGYALDLGDIAAAIRDHDRLMAHWHRLFPGRIYELDYESLVADFDGESRALYEFLGLDWRRKVREFHELERPVRTGSVWQVRQPLYTSSIGKWRDYATLLAPLGNLLTAPYKGAR